jgi:hypothetical protein
MRQDVRKLKKSDHEKVLGFLEASQTAPDSAFGEHPAVFDLSNGPELQDGLIGMNIVRSVAP